ncbi:MAG TPA: sigma-70 family RNA polymerase sigma factor [Opitutaceae bacterium]|jgi:RNA polymerase sigma-70 factor (ECF subfamily)
MTPNEIEALRAFYVDNRQPLYTYALSITRNREAAEDAVAGVFERLVSRDTLPVDLRPFVFRSVRNAAYDACRRTKVRSDSLFASAAEISVSAAPIGPGEDLEVLLRQLAPSEREAIVLRIYSGLSLAEIAELHQAPLPTIASWYRRGLERLRAMLKKEL